MKSTSAYEQEIEELLPFPVYDLTPSELNDHIAKRQALMDALGCVKDKCYPPEKFSKISAW